MINEFFRIKLINLIKEDEEVIFNCLFNEDIL